MPISSREDVIKEKPPRGREMPAKPDVSGQICYEGYIGDVKYVVPDTNLEHMRADVNTQILTRGLAALSGEKLVPLAPSKYDRATRKLDSVVGRGADVLDPDASFTFCVDDMNYKDSEEEKSISDVKVNTDKQNKETEKVSKSEEIKQENKKKKDEIGQENKMKSQQKEEKKRKSTEEKESPDELLEGVNESETDSERRSKEKVFAEEEDTYRKSMSQEVNKTMIRTSQKEIPEYKVMSEERDQILGKKDHVRDKEKSQKEMYEDEVGYEEIPIGNKYVISQEKYQTHVRENDYELLNDELKVVEGEKMVSDHEMSDHHEQTEGRSFVVPQSPNAPSRPDRLRLLISGHFRDDKRPIFIIQEYNEETDIFKDQKVDFLSKRKLSERGIDAVIIGRFYDETILEESDGRPVALNIRPHKMPINRDSSNVYDDHFKEVFNLESVEVLLTGEFLKSDITKRITPFLSLTLITSVIPDNMSCGGNQAGNTATAIYTCQLKPSEPLSENMNY